MNERTYEQQFIKDFADWLQTQADINAKAQKYAAEAGEHDAEVRYESRLEAYEFLQGKIQNYRAGKPFDALPDDFLKMQNY